MSTSIPASGPIRFSQIQTVFGGSSPIFFSEYYTNANPSFTQGVTGIPAQGTPIRVGLFQGKSKPTPGNSLYAFTAHTFTNAGATGRIGPNISQLQTSYSSASWAQNTNNLTISTQGIQLWTVPATGSYTIICAGARGAGAGSYNGGNGALIRGDFNLTQGNVIAIVVGQEGIFGPDSGGGGGGGSFVWINNNSSLLIVAGGGGGGGHDVGFGGGGSTTTTPANGGGSGNGGFQGIGLGGNGGQLTGVNQDWNDAAGGGGGWSGNGANGNAVGASDRIGYGGMGRSGNFIGGYHGAVVTNGGAGNGGFGGGGGSGGNGNSGGGGGGYTGGGGGNNWPGGGNPGHGGGQGGGSFNNGTNQSNTAASVVGNGYVTISLNFIITSGRTYTFNATSGNADASWCTPWTTFCQSLTGTYTRVTMKGSFDSTGRTTNNSTIANGIAQALRNGTDYNAFDSATSFTWIVGVCGGTRALSATGSVCSCESTGWVWRPCINNNNWGGVNTAVCSSPSQTITIEFA